MYVRRTGGGLALMENVTKLVLVTAKIGLQTDDASATKAGTANFVPVA